MARFMARFNDIRGALFALALMLAAPMASAETTTYVDDITGAVDWTAVIAGVGTIAAALAGVYIVVKGARMLLGFLGR